jgi:hypothetical protein
MLQNDQSVRNFRSFRVGWQFQGRPESAEQAATAGSDLPYDCRAAFRQNILDFRLPQKHVLGDMLATETGRNKAGGGSARNHIKPAGPGTGRRAPEQRRHRQREA